MVPHLSPRLLAVVDALPLRPGLRVLEVGPGPGTAAQEVARRVRPGGYVLGIDRSTTAITTARAAARDALAAGSLEFRCVAVEDFRLLEDEAPYDIAFAVRVGALDGRHPELFDRAVGAVRSALVPSGDLFVAFEGDTLLLRSLLP